VDWRKLEFAGMTREELIARIEAGEPGDELLCAIARLVRWRFDDQPKD